MPYKYPRFILTVLTGSKVLRILFYETRKQAAAAAAAFNRRGYETEISDMTFMDGMTGYSNFLKAVEEFRLSPVAVYCVTTCKGYKNPCIAGLLSGCNEEDIIISCKKGTPDSRGNVWRFMNGFNPLSASHRNRKRL